MGHELLACDLSGGGRNIGPQCLAPGQRQLQKRPQFALETGVGGATLFNAGTAAKHTFQLPIDYVFKV